MAWPAYSERFLHHQAEGWWHYTVPPGTRAIVTAVDATNAGAAGGTFQLQIGPIVMLVAYSLAANQVVRFSTRQVAYQGENIEIYITAGVHTTVSGYLLQDNTGRTGPPLVATGKPIEPDRPAPTPEPDA